MSLTALSGIDATILANFMAFLANKEEYQKDPIKAAFEGKFLRDTKEVEHSLFETLKKVAEISLKLFQMQSYEKEMLQKADDLRKQHSLLVVTPVKGQAISFALAELCTTTFHYCVCPATNQFVLTAIQSSPEIFDFCGNELSFKDEVDGTLRTFKCTLSNQKVMDSTNGHLYIALKGITYKALGFVEYEGILMSPEHQQFYPFFKERERVLAR